MSAKYFKGNKLLSERLFAKEYRTVLNWADTTAVELESDIYRTRWAYDPINRAIAVTSPDHTKEVVMKVMEEL